jgi:hypothetical protein
MKMLYAIAAGHFGEDSIDGQFRKLLRTDEQAATFMTIRGS